MTRLKKNDSLLWTDPRPNSLELRCLKHLWFGQNLLVQPETDNKYEGSSSKEREVRPGRDDAADASKESCSGPAFAHCSGHLWDGSEAVFQSMQ